MIQTTPQSLFFTQIRWTQKGPLGFPNIQKHLVTWRDSRLFPPCFGVVLPGRGWIRKSDKRGIVVFFQHHNWKYLRIWDIWDDIVISICLFIWFARILERCLRFLGMAQWWKDKKFKQYMKGPCFFLEPILLQHVALGQAGSLARISILSENVRRRCSFSGALTGQETDPHGPQVINRFRLIVAISGEVLARFLKSSVLEHFGLFGEREPHTTWAESCVFVVRFRVFFSWM